MKDKYIKVITKISFIEMLLVLVLILSTFHYYIGTQSGDWVFNKILNIVIIVFLVVLLIALWIIKLILKLKRLKWLIDFDNSPSFEEVEDLEK